MPRNHTVKQGECLSRIAHQYGFARWQTIYEHPDNAAFRAKRPDPNLIFPGDQLVIPERNQKTENVASGASHRFVVKRGIRRLRVTVREYDGEPFAGQPWKLSAGGKVFSGTTDGQGRIDTPIPIDAEEGDLELGRDAWKVRIGHLNPLHDAADNGISGAQARLRNLGYDPGPIDGVDGPKTRAAVSAFQEANPPLAVDGICGPKTKARLEAVYGC